MARRRSITPTAYAARARRDAREAQLAGATARRWLEQAIRAEWQDCTTLAADAYEVADTFLVLTRSFARSAQFYREQAARARRIAREDRRARAAGVPF